MPAELGLEFKRHELTARHGALLAQLIPGEMIAVRDLARRMGLPLSTVSELAGGLADAGLLERREDPGDRRRTLLALHERYRPQFEAYFARRIAPLTRAMDRLTPAERAGFLAGLAAWAHEAAQSADPKR
ncbi:MarR family winged helix-turn-helix transcriptional regulator [Nonomuraea roseoviolacea]|uniref:MarR family winged helix-turn-helix transcriptional regulator n=1 Tax=Nonomuraea roseoviolacea TaxID=103837 RepID=UPI0031CDB910